MSSTIKVKTLDHKIFEIDCELARCSKTIAMMMDICAHRNAEAHDVIIPFRDWVHSKELTSILSWLKHQQHIKESPKNIATAGGDAKNDTIFTEYITSDTVMNQNKGDGETMDSTETNRIWDAAYIEAMDQSSLMDLIVTVNYLNIETLLEFLCKIITNIVVGKTYEEVCKACRPKTQLTADEIEYLYNENPWLVLGHCESEGTFLNMDDDFESTPEVEDEYFGCEHFCNEDFQRSSERELEGNNNKEKKD